MSATDERDRAVTPLIAPTASPSTTTPSTTTSLRASDAEREATVARLHQALGEGFLDLDETDERVATAYAARLRSELAPLTADLPGHRSTTGAPPTWSEIWTSAVWRSRSTLLGDAPGKPTARQNRTAAVLAVLTVLWLAVCFVLGAAL
jgi:hypothetical protein